ncbi:MAG: hypothetical protein N4A38_01670 [Candidatus Gracilibacteria bacterium]|nr:hypothetical protein [Candidatus Gracilibacteria bacterium]
MGKQSSEIQFEKYQKYNSGNKINKSPINSNISSAFAVFTGKLGSIKQAIKQRKNREEKEIKLNNEIIDKLNILKKHYKENPDIPYILFDKKETKGSQKALDIIYKNIDSISIKRKKLVLEILSALTEIIKDQKIKVSLRPRFGHLITKIEEDLTILPDLIKEKDYDFLPKYWISIIFYED